MSRDQALFMRDVMGVKVQVPREVDVQQSLAAGTKQNRRWNEPTSNHADSRTQQTKARLKKPATGATTPAAPTAATTNLDDMVRERVEAALAERDFEEKTGLSREQFEALSDGETQFATNFPAEYDSAYAVGYTYEDYSTPENLRELEDGYGRNRQFRGLQVRPDINAEEVAKALFGPRTLNAKAAAVTYVRANGLDKPDAYEAKARWGYYGEEAEVRMLPEKEAAAREWFYAFRNAGDENHLLEKARDLGIDTMGLEPKAAVKEILKRTQPTVNWDRDDRFDRIEKVETRSLHTRQLKLTADDLAAYEAAPVENARAGVIGTAFYDPATSSYTLVDGQSNVKNLLGNPAAKRKYIIATLNDNRPRDWRGRVVRG